MASSFQLQPFALTLTACLLLYLAYTLRSRLQPQPPPEPLIPTSQQHTYGTTTAASTTTPPSTLPPPSSTTPSPTTSTIPITRLPPSLLPTPHNNRRLLILGDVHGCLSELHYLLSHVHFAPATDHVIFAGDVINKGPNSHGVLKLMREIGASAVRGNHEDAVLRAWAEMERVDEVRGGGKEGKEGKKESKAEALARQLSRRDIEYIRGWPVILDLGPLGHARGEWSRELRADVESDAGEMDTEISETSRKKKEHKKQNRWGYANASVVHAGLCPSLPLEAQDPFQVMNMRSISVHSPHHHNSSHNHHNKKVYTPSASRDDGEKWHTVWNAYQASLPAEQRRLVVYGHDSKQGLVEKEWSVGLDSGCVKGGRLSALVVGGGGMRVESVRAVRDWTE